MARMAVVLLNLGGPDGPESVQPFLFNLFNDRAIIGLPQPLRWLIAKLISTRRAPVARKIYEHLGGGSPLLANTEAQAQALERRLGAETAVFIAMRYWAPRARDTAMRVKAYRPERIILLPLYPQFSTTTTGSSLDDWRRAAESVGLDAPTSAICCYPTQRGFIEALAAAIRPALDAARAEGTPRLLLTAHGLPKKIVAKGDPYQVQVEETAAAVVKALGIADLDWTVCYQSRVGPLEWIGPATDDEIRRAGRDKVPLVVAPIAFVSEHSETLVELDIEYRHLAEQAGVPDYRRVPTVGIAPSFIVGLADLVRQAGSLKGSAIADGGHRLCPADGRGARCCFAAPVGAG
jgi:protoporphyrin/coproporphyrin ferrochelatase